jgi:hypothetical protein
MKLATDKPKPPPTISLELLVALVHDGDRTAYAVGRAHQRRRARVAQQAEVRS